MTLKFFGLRNQTDRVVIYTCAGKKRERGRKGREKPRSLLFSSLYLFLGVILETEHAS